MTRACMADASACSFFTPAPHSYSHTLRRSTSALRPRTTIRVVASQKLQERLKELFLVACLILPHLFIPQL